MTPDEVTLLNALIGTLVAFGGFAVAYAMYRRGVPRITLRVSNVVVTDDGVMSGIILVSSQTSHMSFIARVGIVGRRSFARKGVLSNIQVEALTFLRSSKEDPIDLQGFDGASFEFIAQIPSRAPNQTSWTFYPQVVLRNGRYFQGDIFHGIWFDKSNLVMVSIIY